MTSPPPAGRRWTDGVWRAGLALVALALALAVGADFRGLQASREAAFGWLQQTRINLDADAVRRQRRQKFLDIGRKLA